MPLAVEPGSPGQVALEQERGTLRQAPGNPILTCIFAGV